MRITLLNDTSDSVNWGCQATSYGIKDIIKSHFQDAQFNTVTNPKLPVRLLKPYRTYLNRTLLKLLSKNNANKQSCIANLGGLISPKYPAFAGQNLSEWRRHAACKVRPPAAPARNADAL